MTKRTAQIGRGQIGLAQIGSANVSAGTSAFSISPNAGHVAGAVTISVTYSGGAVCPASMPITISSGPGSVSAWVQDTAGANGTGHFTYTQAGVSGTPTVFADSVTGTTQSFSNAAVVPSAPTIGTAVRGNASATVAYTAPGDNGGAVIIGYTATSTPGGLTGTGASPITVADLSNGSSYTFTVRATNSVGNSAESSASNSVTPATTPSTPAAPVATVAGTTTALVVITAPANGGSAITGYTVTSSPAGGTDANAGSASLSHSITGLITGVSYTFTVVATNAVGSSAASAASNAIVPTDLVYRLSLAPFVDSDVLTSVTAQPYGNVAGTMTLMGAAPTPMTIASVTNGRAALAAVQPNGASADGSFHGIIRWGTGTDYFADELNIPPSIYKTDTTATVTKICTLPPGTDLSGTIGYQVRDSANAAVGARVTAGILSIPSVTGGRCADITGPVGFSGLLVWDNGGGVYSVDELNIPLPASNNAILASTRTVTTVFTTPGNIPKPFLTGIKWAWFDEPTPNLFSLPTDQGAVEDTDVDGRITITFKTRLSPGSVGCLVAMDSDGLVATVHQAFSGPLVVS